MNRHFKRTAKPSLASQMRISNQNELDIALYKGDKELEIVGKWENVVIPEKSKIDYLRISGTAKVGTVYIYGTVTGNVYISGTGKVGTVYIYDTAKVGTVYIYGTAKVGNVYIYGTVTGYVQFPKKLKVTAPHLNFKQGLFHTLLRHKDGTIQAGCQKHPLEWWLKNGEKLGRNEGYTDVQIAEYKQLFEEIGK